MPAEKISRPSGRPRSELLTNKVMTAQTCSPTADLARLCEILPLSPDADTLSTQRTATIIELPDARTNWTDQAQPDVEADAAAPPEIDSEEVRNSEPAHETPRQAAADDPLRVYLQQMG